MENKIAFKDVNNTDYGILFEYLICEKYKLNIPKYLSDEIFITNEKQKSKILEVIPEIFDALGSIPVKFLGYSKEVDDKGNLVTSPHDFMLDNGKTISIKTNKAKSGSCRVAPRVVGQAGYNVLNTYFECIYGKKIETQEDIKRLFIYKIDEIFPIFIDKTFISDYTIFVERENEENYILVDKNMIKIPIFEKHNFSFAKNLEEWNESNTIKYMNRAIAEVQTPKHRTFKFRFNINNILEFIYESN